jgi:hypothetical protein
MAAQARRRSLTALVGALALAIAGCGTSKDEGISGGGKVIGKTVTVYSLTTDPAGANRDFVDGEKLALADAGGRAGAFSVNFTSLDLGGTDEKVEAAAARRAISDAQIIAAIVDATNVTVPLFNAAGILQVATGGDLSLAGDPEALPSGKRTIAAVASAPPPPANFDAHFKQTFGHAPASSAAAGYGAMTGVLKAIATAGAAGNDRGKVISAYFG